MSRAAQYFIKINVMFSSAEQNSIKRKRSISIHKIMYVIRHRGRFVKTGWRRWQLLLTNFQNEIIEMDVVHSGVEEDVKMGRGQQFIRWSFVGRLGANNIHSILTKFRQNINLGFYIHYSYVYVLTKIETRLRPFYYKQQRGSPSINSFAEAENPLIVKENQQLNLDYVKRTKWVLVNFSNIAVKVVLASQPFLDRGPLAD